MIINPVRSLVALPLPQNNTGSFRIMVLKTEMRSRNLAKHSVELRNCRVSAVLWLLLNILSLASLVGAPVESNG